MADPSRTSVAVTLLLDDAEARRLIVSWPLVPPHLDGAAMVHAWSRRSGVALTRTIRLAEVLIAHGLCAPDRTVDPEAERVVAHVAAQALRATGRKKR